MSVFLVPGGTVHSQDILCIADMNLIAKQISLKLTARDTKQKIEKLRNTIVTFMCPSADVP